MSILVLECLASTLLCDGPDQRCRQAFEDDMLVRYVFFQVRLLNCCDNLLLCMHAVVLKPCGPELSFPPSYVCLTLIVIEYGVAIFQG